MRFLTSFMVILIGFLMLLLGLWVPTNGETYWMLTRIANDKPDHYGYYLATADGMYTRKIDRRRAISGDRWLLGWSEDGRYLVYEYFTREKNPDEGIQVLDIKTGERKWLIRGDLQATPNALQLSPNGKTFALVVSYPTGDVLYTFAADGSHLRELLRVEIDTNHLLRWSADSEWINFSQVTTAEHPEPFRVRRDGTDYAPVSIQAELDQFFKLDSPDKTRYVQFSTTTNKWQMVDAQTQKPLAEPLAIPKNASVVAWLPNDWLLISETVMDETQKNIQVARLLAMRFDGSISKTLVEGEYIRTFQDDKHVYAELTTSGQSMSLVAIDKATLTTQVIIKNYVASYFALGLVDFDTYTPYSLLWVKEANWFIWLSPNRLELYATRPDGSQTRLLHSLPKGSGREEYRISPDKKWLVVTYQPPRFANPPWQIVRIRLADGHQEKISSGSHQVMTMIPAFQTSYHPRYWVLAGGGSMLLAGLSMVLWGRRARRNI